MVYLLKMVIFHSKPLVITKGPIRLAVEGRTRREVSSKETQYANACSMLGVEVSKRVVFFMVCVQPKVGRYIFIYIIYTYNHIYTHIIYSNPPKIEKMKTVKIWNAMIYIITSSKHTIYLWTPIRRHNVNINGMPHSK